MNLFTPSIHLLYLTSPPSLSTYCVGVSLPTSPSELAWSAVSLVSGFSQLPVGVRRWLHKFQVLVTRHKLSFLLKRKKTLLGSRVIGVDWQEFSRPGIIVIYLWITKQPAGPEKFCHFWPDQGGKYVYMGWRLRTPAREGGCVNSGRASWVRGGNERGNFHDTSPRMNHGVGFFLLLLPSFGKYQHSIDKKNLLLLFSLSLCWIILTK